MPIEDDNFAAAANKCWGSHTGYMPIVYRYVRIQIQINMTISLHILKKKQLKIGWESYDHIQTGIYCKNSNNHFWGCDMG